MSYAELVEFSPDEPGIPFDASPISIEVMEKGGDLIHVDFDHLSFLEAAELHRELSK